MNITKCVKNSADTLPEVRDNGSLSDWRLVVQSEITVVFLFSHILPRKPFQHILSSDILPPFNISTILIISLIVKLKYIQRSSFPSKKNHLVVAEVGPIAVHLRQLNYYSRPDYFMVYSCFMKIIRRLKVKFNDIYDWEGEISISEQVSLINSVERIVNFTEHFSYFLANFSSQLSAEINIGKKNSKRNILCLMQRFVWCERSACERGTVCIDRIDSASIEHIIEICSNVRQWQTFIR